MPRLLCILLLALTGCQSLQEATGSTLTREQYQQVVTRARQFASGSELLVDSEKQVVQVSEPKTACYFMAGPHFAQYSISWPLPDGSRITLGGEGNLHLVEGARIARELNPAVQRTGASPYLCGWPDRNRGT